MVLRESGVGAALLGVALATADYAPGHVTGWIVEDSAGWLPRLATTSETIMLYTEGFRAAAFVLGVGAVFALGYRAGERLDLRTDVRPFVLAVGLGGLLGYGAVAVPYALVTLVLSQDAAFAGSATLFGAVLSGRTIAAGVQFAVVGFAGAAFADVSGAGRSNEAAPTPDDGGAAGRVD